MLSSITSWLLHRSSYVKHLIKMCDSYTWPVPSCRMFTIALQTVKQSHFVGISSGLILVRRNMPCFLCNIYQTAYFHSSDFCFKKRKTGEEKKHKNSIHFSPKAKRKDDVIKIWKNMTVAQLAEVTHRDIDDVFEAMIYVENCNQLDSPDSEIDDIGLTHNIARKLGYRCQIVAPPVADHHKEKPYKDAVRRPPPDPSQLVKRPPVVTIMGHIDHGKTTLLDSLRHTSVVKEEFGGITQHIGAFSVKLPSGESITFLDTPGHAAFFAMRARGAHVTDIVVLVVAADDGVMEQTVESIRFAREAEVPIIVAINKMDKPAADIDRVKQGLLAQGIQLEEMGGDVQSVCVSALQGTNLNLLTDALLTQAELANIVGDPKGHVEGVVLESSLDPGRGKLSTALIQRGTLRKGAVLVAGTAWAKVRGMFDEWGNHVLAAPPSTPVQVIGWRELPAAGDEILEVESEKRAREVIHWREEQLKAAKQQEDLIVIQKKLEEHLQVYKSELQQRRQEGRSRSHSKPRTKESMDDDPRPKMSFVLKGDVDGSVEAILDILETYHSHDACRLDLIHYGVGTVTESDVELAKAFNGIIYCFNVNISKQVQVLAQEKKIKVKEFKVIYQLIDDIKESINAQLPLVDKEDILGEANVLEEFLVTEGKKKIPIAGCRCVKGVLKKDAKYRVMRREEVIHEGILLYCVNN
ncbi:translation initiation factor IF-2, mitochondrial-like isoform X2 [Limulus polyphemus]|uniref:Translation initiation factor IF-2, mitochondrial-like isoform X2 n=1 Tax=Limulus polyphemus TaxID=6850 RepID=A0ABM1TJE2_LIMPO|nr:translation initiation factor IF-2, mitochondrial-like isoform X2 [Limulus polyphemus]